MMDFIMMRHVLNLIAVEVDREINCITFFAAFMDGEILDICMN